MLDVDGLKERFVKNTHTLESAVLFSMFTAVYTATWYLSAAPRVEMGSGLVVQD